MANFVIIVLLLVVVAIESKAYLDEGTKTIKVKYHADIPRLEKISQGDWIDLYCAENVVIKTGEYKAVSLGVSMELPQGYEAHIAPRSSIFKNFGVILPNSIGIIDNSYCGDNDVWQLLIYKPYNPYDSLSTTIRKGDRLCQFRLVKKQPSVEIKRVNRLGNADRGGIGSTGINDFKQA